MAIDCLLATHRIGNKCTRFAITAFVTSGERGRILKAGNRFAMRPDGKRDNPLVKNRLKRYRKSLINTSLRHKAFGSMKEENAIHILIIEDNPDNRASSGIIHGHHRPQESGSGTPSGTR
jgi:hypothetical protein